MGNDAVLHCDLQHQCYFNPRSRVGNDGSYMRFILRAQKFQSTFPRGERPAFDFLLRASIQFQSTFPRGERHRSFNTARTVYDFNPRSRVGNDQVSINTYTISQDFNPRSRVGNDACPGICIPVRFYFNPRSRVGNDNSSPFRQIMLEVISIHVPAWGTTRIVAVRSISVVFQSTFPRGERHC